ncbi:hypothetical protein BX600DRAFT_266793 [Xylariales sp. PMI_506]|nr:hypothetical protein BX600DRAFT_266793 [Xylariales sp. PMI_506]
MPRLGYSKSRNGCTRCRQRRVKCDEKQPCSACIRHGIRCSLLDANPTATQVLPALQTPHSIAPKRNSSSPRSAIAPAFSRSPRADAPVPILPAQSPASATSMSPDPFRYFSRLFVSGDLESVPKSTWASDMELMHHYSTSTCFTLPRGGEVSHVWQQKIVKLAIVHDPLLHQVLAVAGFHLAYLNPAQHHNYAMLASQHQSDAARGLRGSLMNPTPEDSHACFAAASLLIIGALASQASPGPRPDGGPGLSDMLDIFMLARGMNAVLYSYESTIQQGHFADLFKLPNYSKPMIYMEAVCGKLLDFRLQLQKDTIDSAMLNIIDKEISNLIECIKQSIKTAPVPEVRVSVTWPIMVTEDYLKLLQQKHPLALTVFCYYCALMHESQSHVWYTGGWGMSVAKDVMKHIPSLSSEATRWPLAYMGLAEAVPG